MDRGRGQKEQAWIWKVAKIQGKETKMKATNTTFGASFFVFSFLVVVVIENQYGENSELILFIRLVNSHNRFQ